MHPRHVLLADNRDISPNDFVRMQTLRDRISHLVEAREQIVASLGLDPDFCLPAANWGDGAHNDFLSAYDHIRAGGYDVLNRLRFWSQAFSGYQLRTLSPGQGTHSVGIVRADHDRWLVSTRPEPDSWVAAWTVATRWTPNRYTFSPPRMLGEIGWNVGGVVVNHDTYAYQERLNLLWESRVLDWLRRKHRPRILEIGGGYGALAYALRSAFPRSYYVICDLPESLMFSGLYLTATTGAAPTILIGEASAQSGFALLPNYLFHTLQGEPFDLVINTLSMSEMTEHQIGVYSSGISRMLGTAGVFFEQNQDNRPAGMLFAKLVVERHFAGRRPLSLKSAGLVHGPADLWSNGDFAALDGRRWRFPWGH